MDQLAIDLAIIPPDEIIKKIIQLNKQLTYKSPTYFNLGEIDYLPHITLAMGSVNARDIPKIQRRLKQITAMHEPIKIVVTKCIAQKKPDATWSSNLALQKTKALKKIHADVMDAMQQFFTGESSENMFITPPAINEKALRWVAQYAKTSAYDKYYPHITLGKGKSPQIKLPISFVVSRIALCHLGTHCTCRRILAEERLQRASQKNKKSH